MTKLKGQTSQFNTKLKASYPRYNTIYPRSSCAWISEPIIIADLETKTYSLQCYTNRRYMKKEKGLTWD